MLRNSPCAKNAFAAILMFNMVLWVFPPGALAEHSVSLLLPNTIPSYCQETDETCGAAVGQMILEGYPGGIEHPIAQDVLMTTIESHENDPGVDWATGPDGLKGALLEKGADPGVNWEIFANPDSRSLMYSIAFWMTKRRFPTPILVDSGTGSSSSYGSFSHWVVIVGFSTDLDPTTNTSVELLSVDYIDPLVTSCEDFTDGGVPGYATGAAWYESHLDVAGNIPASKWHNKFVAVIEPPVKPGVAGAQKLPSRGDAISKDRAKALAITALNSFLKKKKPGFENLQNAEALEPVVVNREHKGYYLVPFGNPSTGFSQGAVLINAYNGVFEEVGVFPKPIRYIEVDTAKELALKLLCPCTPEEKNTIVAQMVFKVSQAQSRFLPLWQIWVGKRTAYINQQGKVYPYLKPNTPGD